MEKKRGRHFNGNITINFPKKLNNKINENICKY